MFAGRPLERHERVLAEERTSKTDRQTPAVAGQSSHVPGAGRAASGSVGGELAAEPVAVEVGGGMVGA